MLHIARSALTASLKRFRVIVGLVSIGAVLSVACCSYGNEEEKRSTANRLADLLRDSKAIQQQHSALFDGVEKMLLSRRVPADAAVEIRNAMSLWFEKTYDFEAIRGEVVEMYLKQFSETELRQMLEFFQTPTGRKVLERNQAIVQGITTIASRHAMALEAEFDRDVERIARKYGLTKEQVHPQKGENGRTLEQGGHPMK